MSDPSPTPPGASLFDSDLAKANSCYTGLVLPEHAKAPPGLRFDEDEDELQYIPEGKLFPDEPDLDAPPLVNYLHDQMRALIFSKSFPCVGGRAAMKEFTYRFGVYDRLASIESVAGPGRDLRRFIAEQTQYADMREELGRGKAFGHFTSLIAVFTSPIPTSEVEFEDLMWQHLQLLHDHDEPQWDPTRSVTPGSPHFAYCFGGRAFFVVGFNPHSSEIPRRFAYPALVFNSEYQIDRLHEEGRFLAFAGNVRERYERLAGRMNPSVPVDVESKQDETRVYSGVHHPEGGPWVCPLRLRPDVRGSRDDVHPPDGPA